MHNSKSTWAIAGLLLIAAVPAALAQDGKPAPAPKPVQPVAPAPKPNTPAASQPAAPKAPKTISVTGKSLSGKDIQVPGPQTAGKIVLINTWATWCPYCKKEIPYWKDANEKFHDLGLEIVGISSDANKNIAADKVVAFTQDQAMPWEQIYDASISSRLGAKSLPWSFLVDGDTGLVIAEREELRRDALAKRIITALADKNLSKLGPAPAKKEPQPKPDGTVPAAPAANP